MVDTVRAWHPSVPGVDEVLHATFREHAYPAHTHDAWTILLIDAGAVRYALDRTGHLAAPATVSILPPHIPHDGRSALAGRAFRKRVLYLEAGWLPAALAAAAATAPMLDADAARTVRGIHAALAHPGDELAAESGVLALRDRLRSHFEGHVRSAARNAPLAQALRHLLDDRYTESLTIAEAARTLGAHPSHLIRAFAGAYGIPPHRYVTGRRVDLARRLLLAGAPPADAANRAGFYDQAHLTRHFRRVIGVTPAAYAA